MDVILIAALDEAGAMGKASGGLPWHVPDEIAHFRQQCRGRWLLLGRRTYEEMKGWFAQWAEKDPHSTPIPVLLSHRPSPHPVRHAITVEEAMHLAQAAGQRELRVIGGASTFAAALPYATHMIVSRLHFHSQGTVFFPPFNETEWQETRRDGPHRDATSGLTFTIQWLHRLMPPQKGKEVLDTNLNV